MIKGKMVKGRLLSITVMLLILLLGFSVTVYAATNDWAQNFSSWVLDGVKWILAAIIGGYSLKFIAKRQFVQFIGFLVLAAVVSVIAVGPDKLTAIGTKLWSVIFGS